MCFLLPEPVISTPTAACIYHRNCLDGRYAAAVALRAEGRCELLPSHHGERVAATFYGRRVYILDVALAEEEMRRIAAEAAEVIWLDHHTSNRALRDRLGWGHIDEEECGATLTWRHCFRDRPPPAVLAFVRDKDLWQWRLPDSRAIAAALEERVDDDHLLTALDLEPTSLIEAGQARLQAIASRVARAARHAVVVQEPYGLREVTALVVNSLDHCNELGDLTTRPRADGGRGLDLAICFGLRADGRWIHSLRSAGVDCARIASNRGGGGHPRAAGYVADRPFPLSVDCLDWPVAD